MKTDIDLEIEWPDTVFPRPTGEKMGDRKVHTIGLTKREYFAGLAMQALSQNWQHYFTEKDYNCNAHQLIAERSCLIADALLEELSKDD